MTIGSDGERLLIEGLCGYKPSIISENVKNCAHEKTLNLMYMHHRTGNDGHKGSTIFFQIQVLTVYVFKIV